MEKFNSRRTFRGAIHNYLETLTSRYSDYDGYWVFGLLFGQLDRMSIDLLSTTPEDPDDPVRAWFASEARRKLKDQIEKARLTMDYLRAASLRTERIAESAIGSINGRPHQGSMFRIVAVVTSDLHTDYRREKQLFVAPHDPSVEHRSTRRRPNKALDPTRVSRPASGRIPED